MTNVVPKSENLARIYPKEVSPYKIALYYYISRYCIMDGLNYSEKDWTHSWLEFVLFASSFFLTSPQHYIAFLSERDDYTFYYSYKRTH